MTIQLYSYRINAWRMKKGLDGMASSLSAAQVELQAKIKRNKKQKFAVG